MPVPISRNWRIPASAARNRTTRARNARLDRTDQTRWGVRLQRHLGGRPVGREVVLAAQQGIVDPARNHRRRDGPDMKRSPPGRGQCCIESTISVRRNRTFAGIGRPRYACSTRFNPSSTVVKPSW
jgi:hypothetical protein